MDAEHLLARVLGIRRLDVYLQFERPVSTEEQDSFRALMKRRATGEPVAYLVGTRGFWKHDFEVGPAVLVPRPETELLVEKALARGGAPRPPEAGPLRVLDVGTGSGCVAISIALELPDAEVVAVDASASALGVARRNAERLAAANVTFREGDGFGPVAAERFDLVVSNPPYIPSGDIAGLDRDVRDFEPRLALDGGPDGLDVIRRWARDAHAQLVPGGWVFFEIGQGQGEAAAALFRDAGFEDVAVAEDLAGIPRVVGGVRS